MSDNRTAVSHLPDTVYTAEYRLDFYSLLCIDFHSASFGD
jgi:hypothetical protein